MHKKNLHKVLYYNFLISFVQKNIKQDFEVLCTIASNINSTPIAIGMSEKLQLIAAFCNEIWPQ